MHKTIMKLLTTLLFFIFFLGNTNAQFYQPGIGNTDDVKNHNHGIDRKKVKCKALELTKEELQMSPNFHLRADTSILPADFPKPPSGVLPCGCHSFRNKTYYLSGKNTQEIFDYYTSLMVNKGYAFEEAQAGEKPNDFILNFSNKKATGSIYVYGDKQAYVITYRLMKGSGSNCNCGANR
ncbi:MAG: hypothetical protein NTX03_00880 [Bacteroidetes bacterium]|nr:hypothetical protein [Bacteroidota bacterium]